MRPLVGLAALVPVLVTLACGDTGGSAPPIDGNDDRANVEESSLMDFRVVTVVEGLERPWGMAFLPGGDILVTERPGRIRLVRDGALVDDPVAGVPADVGVGGQGGLLDIALHPQFESNGWVYLTYSKAASGERTTAVVRGRFEDDRLVDVGEVYEASAWGDGEIHFGSRLAFDAAGRLYVTVGERGEMQEAQNLANDQGTVLRLNDDGSIPEDNPFAGSDETSGAIWAYGVRNNEGLAFHPTTGELWAAEHGPLGGDEINVIMRGRNYGWPEITYGLNYDGTTISENTHLEGLEQPVHHWDDEVPALSGLTIYSSNVLAPWTGHHFVGGLSGRRLVRLEFDGHRLVDSESLLTGLEHRIRDVRTGPDGFLYLLIDTDDAPMLRLEPVDP
jgi:glucose/arabinose dehydrogenase